MLCISDNQYIILYLSVLPASKDDKNSVNNVVHGVFVCFQHFVCAKCEKPFLGHRHYEKKGLAYCQTHYHQVSRHYA